MSRIKVTNIEPQSGQEVFLTGSLTITEVLTAREVRTELTQSSVLFQSGSTQFGDTADDRHQFTGTLDVTGSAIFTSSVDVIGTANLSGTNTISGSNNIVGDTSIGSIGGGRTLIYGTTEYNAGNTHFRAPNLVNFESTPIFEVGLEVTGSLTVGAINDVSASIALNETNITNLETATSASDAALDTRVTINETNISALQTDSGSLSSRVTTNETDISSLQVDSASFSTRVSTNETDISALQSFSSSLDATYATDAELTSVSSSLATDVQANTTAISTNVSNIGSVTADVGLLTAETGSYATTGSNTFTEDQIISSSVLLTLQPIDPAPAVATTGSLIVSGSPAKLYIYDGVGTGWNRVQ